MKLMMHVVVGYPSLDKTKKLVQLMEDEGVDIVELQIPFSDPLADGSTITKACEVALKNGIRVRDAFAVAHDLSKEVKTPLLFMAYYNSVFKYGTEDFCKDAKVAGREGLVVPDIPIEEEGQEHFIALCKKYGLKNIRVLSSVSTEKRLRKNAKVGTGFLYFTARVGTTGSKDTLDKDIIFNLKRVRKISALPIAVGFGISKREHLRALSPYADIGIIGSAIIDIIQKNEADFEEKVRDFIQTLREGGEMYG